MEKHYTLLKAAEILGVTTQTLRNWDNAGKLNTVRTPGNQRRIPESEIKRLLTPADSNVAEIAYEPKRSTLKTHEIYVDSQKNEDISLKHVDEVPPEHVDEIPPVIIINKNNNLLMCKDIAIYDITDSVILNESLLPGCMLNNKMDFQQWMKTRYSRDTNFSSQQLMQRAFGTHDHEHAAYATGAMSLSDCYWIKRQDEDVPFMDITPYIHKEWDGTEASGLQNEYIWGPLSNLFVSGKTDKRWIDAQTLLKVNSHREIEPYNLCAALGLDNMTEAQISNEGILLSNFTSTDVFYESMEQSGITEDNEDPRVIFIEKQKELAIALFVIDYLVENNDRQPDDYGFLRSSSTGEYISMAPFYNFDWIWSGESVPLPDFAWNGYSRYIRNLCNWAISAAKSFEYGTIIEKRALELLRI